VQRILPSRIWHHVSDLATEIAGFRDPTISTSIRHVGQRAWPLPEIIVTRIDVRYVQETRERESPQSLIPVLILRGAPEPRETDVLFLESVSFSGSNSASIYATYLSRNDISVESSRCVKYKANLISSEFEPNEPIARVTSREKDPRDAMNESDDANYRSSAQRATRVRRRKSNFAGKKRDEKLCPLSVRSSVKSVSVNRVGVDVRESRVAQHDPARSTYANIHVRLFILVHRMFLSNPASFPSFRHSVIPSFRHFVISLQRENSRNALRATIAFRTSFEISLVERHARAIKIVTGCSLRRRQRAVPRVIPRIAIFNFSRRSANEFKFQGYCGETPRRASRVAPRQKFHDDMRIVGML
jgi:hypothetical protein